MSQRSAERRCARPEMSEAGVQTCLKYAGPVPVVVVVVVVEEVALTHGAYRALRHRDVGKQMSLYNVTVTWQRRIHVWKRITASRWTFSCRRRLRPALTGSIQLRT